MLKTAFASASAFVFLFGFIMCVYWIGGALDPASENMREISASAMFYR